MKRHFYNVLIVLITLDVLFKLLTEFGGSFFHDPSPSWSESGFYLLMFTLTVAKMTLILIHFGWLRMWSIFVLYILLIAVSVFYIVQINAMTSAVRFDHSMLHLCENIFFWCHVLLAAACIYSDSSQRSWLRMYGLTLTIIQIAGRVYTYSDEHNYNGLFFLLYQIPEVFFVLYFWFYRDRSESNSIESN